MAERNSSSGTTPGSQLAAGHAGTGASTQEYGSTASNQGGGLADKVRERAKEQLSSQKDRATDGLGSVVQAVRQSSRQLRDEQHDQIASYVEQAADQMERFSQALRNKDVGELVEDAQRLARRQPALFVGSAFALGLVGARFFKSSPPEPSSGRGDWDREGYGSGGYSGGVYSGGTSYTGAAGSASGAGSSGLGGSTAGSAGAYGTGSTSRGAGASGTTTGAASSTSGSAGRSSGQGSKSWKDTTGERS